jgi:signal transduction histidine kinase
MRRLHLRLYLTIVGTLVAFAVSAAVMWHIVAWPQGAAWSIQTATYMSVAMLEEVRDPKMDQEVVTALARQLHADVVLLPGDATSAPISHGQPYVPDAKRLSRAGWRYDRGERSFAVDLKDGRKLIVHSRYKFLFHGMHMVLFLSTLAAILALLVYPLARGITARLGRLKQSVQNFGSGNLSARVAVEGRDEIAALANSFNESAERVEQLVRANQMLLANCSHELRTPLARMRLAIERLRSGDGNASTELAQNIAELDLLIGELLLSSRLDAAKRLERAESLDLLALAAEEAAHFDLEVSGEPVTIVGDAHLLRRLIRNLLENARVHAGGASEVRISRSGANARIHIEDTGEGIAPEDRERIFEPFYRRQASTQSTGVGLGLSIVRQIARVHGGDVTCETRDGGGSRFIATLPVSHNA